MPVFVARALAAVALVAAACGTDMADSGADAGPARAELGSGIDAFEPLADGDDVAVVQGPQGGFHVYGSVAVTGLDPGNADDLGDPGNPTTSFRVFDGATRVDIPGAAEFTQGLRPVGGTSGVGMIGRLVILDITADDELAGKTLRFEVSVTDSRGASATDSRTVVAVPHPNNP